jgi:predicted RND superfamily exporter protein
VSIQKQDNLVAITAQEKLNRRHMVDISRIQFFKTGLRHHSLVHAIEETGWPLLFSALTTIAALLSFLLVPMRPIRWAGVSSACLAGVTYVLVIVLLPSLLIFGKDRTPGSDLNY